HVLEPLKETRIPAPAIEQASGVAFLQSLGVELPERVRERVRTVEYEVAIKCELKPSFPRAESEDCVVTVVAEAADGKQQTWTGYNWLEQTQNERRRRSRREEMITLYDRRKLEAVPALLESLRIKPLGYGGGLGLRVTKRFGEVFSAWLKSVPPEITVQLAGDLASFGAEAVAGRVKLDATEAGIDWFDLRVVLDVSDATLTAEEIKLLLNARGGYVRLAGKGWG